MAAPHSDRGAGRSPGPSGSAAIPPIPAGAVPPAGADRLRLLLQAPPPLLVVSDFDGTVSPIDPDPLAAKIEPRARLALRRLAGLAAARPDRLRVVVLSGRAAIDVARRVRVGGLEYLGNHGLEGGKLPRRARAERLVVAFDDRLAPFVAPAARLGREVAHRVDAPWLFVEHKGPSVAFHFRQASDPDEARRRVLDAIADAERDPSLPPHGLARFEGRRVVELRPADAGGKGAAMERLLEQVRPGAVLVMGDDRTDAEAFRIVSAARENGGLAASLAVAVLGGRETPPEVLAAADLTLPGPRDAARLLLELAAELGSASVG